MSQGPSAQNDPAARDHALAKFDEAIRRDPQNADLYVLKAKELLAQQRVDEALVELDVAVALGRGQSFSAYQTRGEARLLKNDPAGALEDFDRALDLEPASALAVRGRGECRLALKQYAEALADFDRALGLLPPDARSQRATTLCRRALVHIELRDWDAALRDLNQANALDSTLTETYRTLRAQAIAQRDGGDADGGRDEPDDGDASERREAVAPPPAADAPTAGSLGARIKLHFAPLSPQQLFISQRAFPLPARSDLQVALETWLREAATIAYFCGRSYGSVHEILTPPRQFNTEPQPPHYDDIEVGDPQPVRCLRGGLWLLSVGETKCLLLLNAEKDRLTLQLAAADDAEGRELAAKFFAHVKESVRRSPTLRGKVISLGGSQRYAGQSQPVSVHALPQVRRADVILPDETLELLERNVLEFLRQRPKLVDRGLPAKKRLLVFGPSGVGKTHVVRYLLSVIQARVAPPNTTLLVPPLKFDYLPDYLELARLLEPSVVVAENLEMVSPADQTALVHEMRHMPDEAEVLFLLTASSREAAARILAGAADRVDQVIELKLPDANCRQRLVKLYAGPAGIADDVAERIVARCDNVSAAFLHELLRRAVQYQVARDAGGSVTWDDVQHAWNELQLNEDLLSGPRDIGFQPLPL
jgi:hypothetical protein